MEVSNSDKLVLAKSVDDIVVSSNRTAVLHFNGLNSPRNGGGGKRYPSTRSLSKLTNARMDQQQQQQHIPPLPRPPLLHHMGSGDSSPPQLQQSRNSSASSPKSYSVEDVDFGDINRLGIPEISGCDNNHKNNNNILHNHRLMTPYCEEEATPVGGGSPLANNPNLAHLSPQHSFNRGSTRRYQNSVRSWKSDEARGTSSNASTNRPFSDTSSQFSRPFSDTSYSARSLASIGMGSTDGRRMIIRKVPQSPSELFNIVNPPTPPEEYLYEADSYDDISDSGDSVYKRNKRYHWSNKLQFVLACVGYSVGLGSVWRFPYLCYKSGGGVFLIPYLLIMVVCGIPLLYMELAVGQFTGRGPIGALGQLCPLFKGAGLASVVISFLMSTYYSVIIAYGIYYFFTSFKSTQPWESCSNRFNTHRCWDPTKIHLNSTRPLDSRTPAEEFYDIKVLNISKGIEYPGTLRWELVACLFCAWLLVYFAIWKSIKSSAKVRYITATFPFILILVFLVKSLTLEGANKGMHYFFKPKWELLKNAQVWISAAAQTFNSMGIAFGSMISFASYNKFNNNILRDTLAVSFLNAITSMLVGIFAFATIGNIATELNTSVEDVIADGPGLIFVVYPQAMAKMPASRLWAVLFFFMLLCLALNSQFAIVEVVVTSIQDGFSNFIKRHLLCHEMLVLIICVVSFLCGLPNVTRGGIYFFQLMDHYAASISIMYLAFFEVIAIAWFYGVRRLSRNVETMTGRQPNLYFKLCWAVAAPMLIFAVWIFCLIDYIPPTYDNGTYHYPVWAVVLGWIISSLSILCIPVFAVYVFVRRSGSSFLEKLKSAIQPNISECDKCGELCCEHTQELIQEGRPMLILQTGIEEKGSNIINLENSTLHKNSSIL